MHTSLSTAQRLIIHMPRSGARRTYMIHICPTKSCMTSNDLIYVHSSQKKKTNLHTQIESCGNKLRVVQKFASTLVILVITETEPKLNGYYRNRTVSMYKTV